MQNQCCEIKLRAERRMGELLGASPRQKPGQYQRSHDVTVAPALSEMGVSKMQSSRWQALARLPKREFEGFITETKDAGRELTTTAALKLAKQREARQQFGLEEEGTPRTRGKVAASLEALAKSKTRFGCILADDHAWMRKILNRRIRDGVLIRTIGKWLNAGIMEDGRRTKPTKGTPQGGVLPAEHG